MLQLMGIAGRLVRLFVGLLVAGVVAPAPSLLAFAPGTWELSGSMATARRHSVIERLPNGKFLVAGGVNTTGVNFSASIFHASAEVYDPATGTWSATGSLNSARAQATSSILPDGKILIIGGINGGGPLATAEIYDPVAGTFSFTVGAMSTARGEHADAILPDGRVLVMGGYNGSGTPLASAEIFNPATGLFSPTGAMSQARYGHTGTTLGGKVLVFGGFAAGGNAALQSAELYDLAFGTFSAAGAPVAARGNHVTVELPIGRVLIAGGHSGSAALASTEIYDPDNNIFSAGPSLSQARQSANLGILPSGLAIIIGGNNSTSSNWDVQSNFLVSVDLYNPVTNTITGTGSLPIAVSGANRRLPWHGRMMVVGGGTTATQLYTPAMTGSAGAWQAGGNLQSLRTGHQQNLLGDGRVLLSGGQDTAGGTPLATAELYDYATNTSSATAGNMASPRMQHRTAVLWTGKVLVTGGRATATTGVLNSTEFFDPASGTFSPGPNMQNFRRVHRPTTLTSGKVLFTGGLGGTTGSSNTVLNTAEVYDPVLNNFTATAGTMVVPRRSHQQVRLRDGRVLVVGGFTTGTVAVSSAEIYNPATNTFSATGSMAAPRISPTLNTLPNGRILVSGGSDGPGNPLASVEIYDPATGLFSATGSMAVARDGNRNSVLDNGLILSAAGQFTINATDVTASSELYNHLTGTFSATGSMTTARQDAALSGLPNGRILMAGGVNSAGTPLASTELYTPLIGNPVVNCPTDSLQTAINLAPAGTTILVSGTCSENILIRNEKQRLTIDGQGTAVVSAPSTASPAFNVRGKGILIARLTITGGGVGVHINRGSNAVLQNNVIQNSTSVGVIVEQLSFAVLTGNTIQNHPDAGIFVGENATARLGFNADSDVAASANTIQANGIGIAVARGGSARIVGNIIQNNLDDGVQISRDSHVDLASNDISGNVGDGIEVAQNAVVQLGEDSGTGIFETANASGNANTGFGLRCRSGGMVDGRRGSLTGGLGNSSFDASCVDSSNP